VRICRSSLFHDCVEITLPPGLRVGQSSLGSLGSCGASESKLNDDPALPGPSSRAREPALADPNRGNFRRGERVSFMRVRYALAVRLVLLGAKNDSAGFELPIRRTRFETTDQESGKAEPMSDDSPPVSILGHICTARCMLAFRDNF